MKQIIFAFRQLHFMIFFAPSWEDQKIDLSFRLAISKTFWEAIAPTPVHDPRERRQEEELFRAYWLGTRSRKKVVERRIALRGLQG